jgi:hypothetical protein
MVLLVHSDGPPSLQAVLTCRERALAQRAADLLGQLLHEGSGKPLRPQLEKLAQALPDAPAASFNEAVARTVAGAWPVEADTLLLRAEHPELPDIRDRELVAAETRTPEDARLADLFHPVVRVVRVTEFHVHDPERVMALAASDGWEPPFLHEAGLDESEDLIDALMSLSDVMDTVPGADTISGECEGTMLDPGNGDELAGMAESG